MSIILDNSNSNHSLNVETSQHAYPVYAPGSDSRNSHNYYGLPMSDYGCKHISIIMLVALIVLGLYQGTSGHNTTGSTPISTRNSGATSTIPSIIGSGTVVSTGATETSRTNTPSTKWTTAVPNIGISPPPNFNAISYLVPPHYCMTGPTVVVENYQVIGQMRHNGRDSLVALTLLAEICLLFKLWMV